MREKRKIKKLLELKVGADDDFTKNLNELHCSNGCRKIRLGFPIVEPDATRRGLGRETFAESATFLHSSEQL